MCEAVHMQEQTQVQRVCLNSHDEASPRASLRCEHFMIVTGTDGIFVCTYASMSGVCCVVT